MRLMPQVARNAGSIPQADASMLHPSSIRGRCICAGDDQVLLSALNAQNGQRLWSLNTPIDGNSSLLAAHGRLCPDQSQAFRTQRAKWHGCLAIPCRLSNTFIACVTGSSMPLPSTMAVIHLTLKMAYCFGIIRLTRWDAGVTTAPVLLNGTLFVKNQRPGRESISIPSASTSDTARTQRAQRDRELVYQCGLEYQHD